ncbi:hypothetical protein DYB32_004931 [Aphanomyces invadans]|uniref:EF-hand domain-containing protein n=1 Tax=Aphanomyces invadans TaxID=157072 RepID=A0A3R6WN43_9STRA|nr:hypothetical protein DYB32_004931 [Aphanomyces invadans]
MLLAGATLTKETTASNEEVKESSAEKKKKEKKKTHWHTRQRHEESDKQAVLLKDSLKKYKEDIVAFDSVASRFDTFATAMTKDKDANGVRRKAMTFTGVVSSSRSIPHLEPPPDFLHSLVLPRFRLSHPSFHAMVTPKVGTVDKTEFLEVLSSVLNNIKDIRTSASGTGDDAVQVEASYHLLLHFFGKNGKKKITAREFVAVVQSLKESLLRAEFDMYATKDSVVLSARNNQAAFRKNAPTWPPAKFWACVTNPSTD